jgi:hypothetical protein
MNTPERAVRARLLQLPALTALVGTRVYVGHAPQGVVSPFVSVQLIDEVALPHLRGSGGPKRSRVQVDVFARERSGVDAYDTAADIAAAIDGPGDAGALDGWRGIVDDLLITGAFRIDRRPLFVVNEQRLERWQLDYMIHWRWHSFAAFAV